MRRLVWTIAGLVAGSTACAPSGSSSPDAARDGDAAHDAATNDGGSSGRSVVGRVVAVVGAREDVVAGALVHAGGVEAVTDELGLFVLDGVRGDRIDVRPPDGYGTTSVALDADTEALVVPLLGACEAALDATTGGAVRFERCAEGGGAELFVPPSAFVDEGGARFTGRVRVRVSVAAPEDLAQLDALPRGEEWVSDVAGGLEVRLSDADGDSPVELAAGVVVTVRVPVRAADGPLRVETFDESTGRWVDDGVATVTAGLAELSASHFSHRRLRPGSLAGTGCLRDAVICLDPRVAGTIQRSGVVRRSLPTTETPACIPELDALSADGCLRVPAERPYRFAVSHFRPLSRQLFVGRVDVTAPARGETARAEVALDPVRLGCLSDVGACPDSPDAVPRALEVRQRDVGRVAMLPSVGCDEPYCVPVPVEVPLETCSVGGRCYRAFTLPGSAAGSVCGGSGSCFTPPAGGTPTTLQLRVAGAGSVSIVGASLTCRSGDFDRTNPTSCAEPFTGTIELRATPDASFGVTATHWAGDCATEVGDVCTVFDGASARTVVACFHDGSETPTGRPRCVSLYGE